MNKTGYIVKPLIHALLLDITEKGEDNNRLFTNIEEFNMIVDKMYSGPTFCVLLGWSI